MEQTELFIERLAQVFMLVSSAVSFWMALDTQRFFRWFGRGPGPYPRWHIIVFKVLGWIVGIGVIRELLRFQI
jgi:hypothetical protein